MRSGDSIAAVFCVLLLIACFPNSPRARAQEPSAEPAVSPYATSQPFRLVPRTERASLELRRPTVRSLYDAIAQAYGVRLLYDREVGPVPLSSDFHLQNATLEEALDAATSVTRTFVAPLDPHTGLVANDTPDKRVQYERQLMVSFRLDAQTTPQQITEISTALRTILDLRRVSQDSNGWITVSGRQRQIEAAGEFLATLQKPSAEAMLEIDVWEIDSSRLRRLGLQPPQTAQLVYLGRAATNAASYLTFGMGRTLYGMSFAGFTALLNSDRSLMRSHQSFSVRVHDGLQANLLGGERVPVATSLFLNGSGAAAGTATGLFPAIQYQDTGVVIHATPYFHTGRELTLQLDFALRNVGARDQNGLPTFGQRAFTGQIRLKEGEAALIAGILNGSDRYSISGHPLLSRLPLLGALFSTRERRREETELVIAIRPHITRFGPEEEIASRAIYFGRELTGLPAPAPEPPAAPQAPQPVPGVPGQPGAAPQPGVQLPAGAAPPEVNVQPGAQPGTPQPQIPTLPPGISPGAPIPGVPNPPSQGPAVITPGAPPSEQPPPPQNPRPSPEP